MGFTEVKLDQNGYKYVLIFANTFSGGLKVSPIRREIAQVTIKKPLKELVSQFSIPLVMWSKKGPAFIT